MSPSEPSREVPPEVLAIAVALAADWQAAEAAAATAAGAAEPEGPSDWRWSGRRWERPASHRWS